MPDAILHPTPDELAAFHLGKLDGAAATTVADHLAACETCHDAVAKLPGDSFVNLVRAARPGGAPTRSYLSTPPPADTLQGAPPPLSGLPPELAAHPKYRVVAELGRGGMGVVYKAEHRLMGRLVAIKVINKALLDRTEVLERFHREVKAAAQLAHSNIVIAHDAEPAGDLHLLVMEYVSGTDLAKVVAKHNRLPVRHACAYARQAAFGLQHAFERGMVHRDIKPQNLMLTPEGRIKILDFGLALLVSEQKHGQELTEQNAMMGTPAYMAPEQGSDAHSADIRADIYSLGCTLYCLLTGEPPFAGGSAMHVIFAHKHLQAKPLHEANPQVPPALSAVVAKMMAKEPADRYATPGEVAQALVPFCKAGTTNETMFAAKGAGPVSQNPPTLPPNAKKAAPVRQDQAAAGAAANQAPTKRKPFAFAVVVGLLLAGFVGLGAGVVFKVKTQYGTIVLEDLPDGAEVTVDGAKVKLQTTDGQTYTVSIAAGKKQRLQVTKEGFSAFGEDVEIGAGGHRPIHVRLEPLAPALPPAAGSLAPENSEWAGVGANEKDGTRRASIATVTITERRGRAFKALVRTGTVKVLIEGTIEDGGDMTHKVTQVIVPAADTPLDKITGSGEVGKNRMTLLFNNPDTGGTVRYELKRLPDAGANFDFVGRWKCVHRPTAWSGVRTVQDGETFVDWNGQKGTWSRDGGLIHVNFAGGGVEYLAIDPDNPNELNGPCSGGIKATTWVRESPLKKAADARPADPLPAGSVWKGTRSYRQGMWAGATVTYELHVQERDGKKFRGLKFDNGVGRNRHPVEGEIDGADLKWREAAEWQVVGKLDNDTIRLTFTADYGPGRTTEGDGELTRVNP